MTDPGLPSDRAREPFSDHLERWLATPEQKTVGDLGTVFGDRSFAVWPDGRNGIPDAYFAEHKPEVVFIAAARASRRSLAAVSTVFWELV